MPDTIPPHPSRPRYPDVVALIASLEEAPPHRGIRLIDARFRESWHPYRSVFRRIRFLAGRFLEQGLRPGHKVQIPLATEPDAFCSFLALIWVGATPFSVTAPLMGQDRSAHRRRMVDLMTRHGVDRLLVSEDLSGIAGVFAEVPLEKELAPGHATDDEIAQAPTVAPAIPGPEDVAFVQFSSGSTSHPKGVRVTHRGLVRNLELIVDNDRRTSESVMVSWLPLYHDMGLVGCLLSNLVLKNDLILMHPRCFLTRPVSWLDAITRFRGTVAAVPNFALEVCSDRIDDEELKRNRIDLRTFRYVYDGAEPVRPASIRRFEERFGRYGFVPGSVYPVYGMSETTLIATAPSFDEPEIVRPIEGMEVPSVGFPLGDFEIRVVDEQGADLGSERIGEILIRGTCVTPGYLETSNDAETLRDGWLATGDLGLLDGAGRLYITGRKKDLIIHQGKNFYGHDIAATVGELPFARRGDVFAFGADVDGEEKVVVMLAPAKSADEAVIDDTLRRHVLAEFGLAVDEVVIVPRIPKTTSGKVSRQACEQIYRDSRTAGG